MPGQIPPIAGKILGKAKMMRNFLILTVSIVGIVVLLAATLSWINRPAQGLEIADFDSDRALQDVANQLSFGPRLPGSKAHQDTIDYFLSELERAGWAVEVQQTNWDGHDIKNVIAKRGSGSWIILGAHFDTRMVADRDPEVANVSLPVPGANDGASGCAVLLELARTLPKDLDQEVWLVFFDAEDQGNIPGWDWILGSRAMVASLPGVPNRPEAVVILDMIGDRDLDIYMERNSNEAITREIWSVAAELGFSKEFIPQNKFAMLDDHTPFLELGIPAVDIIDFDYDYYHTTQDTLDKVSAESLEAVGRTIQRWIMVRQRNSN